jgi:two-component system LytT family response regulator
MMTAIGIDDEPVALEVIKAHAAKVPFMELKGLFTNAFQALDYLRKEKVDVLFLDIKMPDVTGIELLKSLPNPPLVVFTTAYSEHAVHSFELDAIDYLLKPFSLARFLKACNKVHAYLQLKHEKVPGNLPDFIFIKSGYDQVRVLLTDILYLESAGNYVNFMLKDRKLLSRLSMSEAIRLLPESLFTRVHRSFIVSNNQVSKIDRTYVWVQEVPIPIGSAYTEEVGRIWQSPT